MSDEVTRQAAEASGERNVRRDDYDWMVKNRNEWKQDRDEWKQCADTLEGAVQRMTTEVHGLTAERDAARADLRQAEENNHGLIIEAQNMRAGLVLATEERDNWQQRAETAERASAVDAQAIQRATNEVHRLKNACEQLISERNRVSAERDAALVEVRSQITEIRAISVDRDSAEDHNGFLREKCQKLEAERDAARAEAEGLRADLLAHPPETHTELAAERKRHLELIKDYDRREVVITTLEEALKRAESMLKAAQGQHIDERLKGFLAVISQLADQAQDLLP